jgi:hypothetical protein
MALSNAEKQRRFRERNQIILTDDAAAIAATLIAMDDQRKLKKIASYITDHLKHPERNADQRAVALGFLGTDGGLNGPLSKKETLAYFADDAPRKPKLTRSWRVEVTDDKGQRWGNGVRLESEEEAKVYADIHAREEVAGYITGEVIRTDEPPPNSLSRTSKRAKRVSLVFMDGECWRLGWRPVGIDYIKPVAQSCGIEASPEEIKENILDTVAHAGAVASAMRKILKVASLGHEAKARLGEAIAPLIAEWRSVQALASRSVSQA